MMKSLNGTTESLEPVEENLDKITQDIGMDNDFLNGTSIA
jgi:hypothetical protein